MSQHGIDVTQRPDGLWIWDCTCGAHFHAGHRTPEGARTSAAIHTSPSSSTCMDASEPDTAEGLLAEWMAWWRSDAGVPKLPNSLHVRTALHLTERRLDSYGKE